MEDEELNIVLEVLENPVRRKIVKRLSQGPSYALQLSKELGMGQPLVAKHLTMMEQAGIVSSNFEPSSVGPERRRYSLARSVSITLDMAPNLFIQRGFSFGSISEKELPAEAASMMGKTSRITGEKRGDIPALTSLLARVDQRLDELEDERAALLYVRNQVMSSASKAIERVEGRDRQRVIYNILEEHDRDVERISEALDLREAVVREILNDIRELFS